MKLSVKLNASETQKRITVDLSDIGITDKEWKKLSDEEKQNTIIEYVDGCDQPYWALDSFSIKE